MGPAPSFTIIYGDFLESTGQAGTAITILNSLFNISFSCAGNNTVYNLKIKYILKRLLRYIKKNDHQFFFMKM